MKLLFIFIAACAPAYSTTASSTFASTYSCPTDRQTVTREPPPADIAGDPERAKLWRADHHLYNVTGCGRTVQLECYVIGGDALSPNVDCMLSPAAVHALLLDAKQ